MYMESKYHTGRVFACAVILGMIFECGIVLAATQKKDPISIRPIDRVTEVSGVINTGFGDAVTDKWVAATREIRTIGMTSIGYKGAKFRAPRIVLNPGFRVDKGNNFEAGVPTFKVHFVNMVKPADADPGSIFAGSMTQAKFDEFCRNEVEILNHYFKNENGGQLVRFEFKDARLWDPKIAVTYYYTCMRAYNPSPVSDDPEYGHCHDEDPSIPYETASQVYNLDPEDCPPSDPLCSFAPYRDDAAINFNIFYSGSPSGTSYGGSEKHWYRTPNIDVHYRRIDENLWVDNHHTCAIDDCGMAATPGGTLPTATPGGPNNGVQDDDHNRGGVEPHEMGHTFGVHHVCDQTATDVAPFDNIMMSGNISDTALVDPTDPSGAYDWAAVCRPLGNCQEWGNNRSGEFMFDPFGEIVPASHVYHYKFQQYSYSDTNLYEVSFDTLGQAELIMNQAEYYELFTGIE